MATLPVSAIASERARDVGLVTQGWLGWAGDVAKSEAIGALFAAAGGALLIGGMRRFGRRWWIPGAATVVAFGVIITYAGPVVLDPVFNKFKRLPAGETRSDVLALAKRAGVDVGEVYEIDASRRTSAANAYVNGLGHTKRVVLYDNLLRDFTPAEVRLVVAHELGHVQHRDVPRGLLYLAIVAPFGMFAVARLGERLAPRDAAGTPLALPAVVLAVALVAPAITVDLQPALTCRRAQRGRLRARAHARAGDPDRVPAQDRDQERLGPRPPGLGHVPARHPPADDRADRSGRERRPGRPRARGRRGSARSGW